MSPYVTAYELNEISIIERIAKRRRYKLPWKLTEADRNDPAKVAKFFKAFGNYPDDETFAAVKEISKLLNVPPPTEAALNRFACLRFINEHPLDAAERGISDEQRELLKLFLRATHRPHVPEECWHSETSWENYLGEYLTPEKIIEIKERLAEMDMPASKYNWRSFGGPIVAMLDIQKYEGRKQNYINEQIKNRLIDGEDPYSVAELFGVPDERVLLIEDGLWK